MDFMFGMIGVMGALFGIAAYTRVDKLEKKLKALSVLPADFDSEADD